MRLLFVSACFPIPIDCGQHVRTEGLIQACARRFEVAFVLLRKRYGGIAASASDFATATLSLADEPQCAAAIARQGRAGIVATEGQPR